MEICKNMRGFDLLIGEEIVDIDATAINVVRLHTKSGKVVEIDAEYQHYGISIIAASLVAKKQ